MVDEKLLEILVCPENHTPLAPADEELVAKLNRAIDKKRGQLQVDLGTEIFRHIASSEE